MDHEGTREVVREELEDLRREMLNEVRKIRIELVERDVEIQDLSARLLELEIRGLPEAAGEGRS